MLAVGTSRPFLRLWQESLESMSVGAYASSSGGLLVDLDANDDASNVYPIEENDSWRLIIATADDLTGVAGNEMIGVHHQPKWHKFGIMRSWDTLSMEIRAGRKTRDEAIAELAARGDETPWEDIALFCEYLGISREEYVRVVEGFRDRDLWTRRDGRWVIEGFLLPDFPWPADA